MAAAKSTTDQVLKVAGKCISLFGTADLGRSLVEEGEDHQKILKFDFNRNTVKKCCVPANRF